MKQYLLSLSCLLFLANSYNLTGAQIHIVTPANIKPSISSDRCIQKDSNLLRSQLALEAEQLFSSNILPQLYGLYSHFPAKSCADIYQDHPSGYYWLNVASEPQLVYCSLNENRCCGESNEKWMRIAYLNMSDPGAQCPYNWREIQSPIHTCRRQNNTSISSVNYTSYGIPYSRVCGRIIAYQFGTPDGFLGYIQQDQQRINDAYVDGISVTFDHPRNHIWTFAAARDGQHTCPCLTDGNAVPTFVNGDHFCEVGIRNDGFTFIPSNPLWDGQDCAGSSACCEFNNPPWFCKQLNYTTTKDIEIRLLGNVVGDHSLESEDTPVQLIEIYVQ